MTTVYQDIQAVRSLRKELRDPVVSETIMNAIHSVHNCVQAGTDLNGWKRVNWRNNHSSAPTAGSGGHGGNGGNSNNGRSFGNDRNNSFRNNHVTGQTNSRGNGFFRSSGNANTNSSSSGNASAFSSGVNRNRPHTTSAPQSSGNTNQPSSVPLSSNTQSQSQPQPQSNNHSHNHSHNYSSGNSYPSHHNKYVSKFRKDSEAIDDTIINTILMGKLNKMSVANYDEVKEFITHIIDSDQTEMTKCFMRLVFQKATVEEVFCPLYARLLSELSTSYPVLLTEMANLYTHYMSIFEEVNETSETQKDAVIEKKYRRGYSQFLAELIKHGVVNTDMFIKTIQIIVKQVETNMQNEACVTLNQEYSDCLLRIINAIKSDDLDDDDDNISEIKNTIKSDIHSRIKPFTEKNADNKGISTKTRFMFLNIYEDIEKF